MTIFDKLKFTGIEIGNVQSVDEMTIVPILGDNRGEVAGPEHLKFKSTTSYGTMVFENDDPSQPAIVPNNMMVRGKGAQDHAMAGSGVVLANRTTRFNTACCIEESQGGYLNSEGNEVDVLPIQLRKVLLQPSLRQAQSYSKLWSSIKTWLKGVPVGDHHGYGAAHLRYFYDTPDIRTALEQFAAEFEPVDNQIGAIIMFSGVPVGVEIMPSSEHWQAYWKLLLRGCYGAEMLRLKMLGKLKESTLVLPNIPAGATAADVKQIMENFSQHLRQEVLPILESIDIKSQKLSSQDGSLQTVTVNTTSGGGGDLIQQSNIPIYLSLVL
jgi:hypothetical protein